MCEKCGCIAAETHGLEERGEVSIDNRGWHVHADGTVHKHEQPHIHSLSDRESQGSDDERRVNPKIVVTKPWSVP